MHLLMNLNRPIDLILTYKQTESSQIRFLLQNALYN